MSRLLISIDRFEAYSLHNNEILDIIDALLSQGWQIDIVAHSAGKALAGELMRLTQSGAFRLITDKQGALADSYTLIWIYKGFFSGKLLEAISELSASAPVIFRHFSDYNDLYIPYGVTLENQLASRTLSLSPLVTERLLATGVAPQQLHPLPYTVAPVFAAYQPTRILSTLQRVLYVAPEMSAEMYEVQQRLSAAGIQLEWFDNSQPVSRIQPDWLEKYDVVIGSEEIAPKALALGIPLFLAAGGYVEGYLGAENIARWEGEHFTAVNLRSCPDADEWLELLMQGFTAAAKWSRQQQAAHQQKWSISSLLEALISAPLVAKSWKADEKSLYALRFHSQTVLAAADNKNYSMERWLEDRRISDTRRQALQAFVQSLPESGSIGVAIIDEQGDSARSQRSLASVMQQSWPPVSIDIFSVADLTLAEGEVARCALGWPAELNRLINHSSAEALLVLSAGDELLPDALLLLAEQRLRQPATPFWYMDEMYSDGISEPDVVLRPDVNIDLLRSTPYIGRTLLFSRPTAQALGALSADYPHLGLFDLLWRAVEQQGAGALGHLPEVLVKSNDRIREWAEREEVRDEYQRMVAAHLQRLGIAATLEPGLTPTTQRVRYRWESQPLVSIIIPTRDHFALLKACIESLMESTRYQRYELLIVDNQSTDQQACRFLNDLQALGVEQIRVLRYDAPFNYAAINNAAAEQARGDLLLFLNNDCQIIEGEWLDALLEQALRPEIALVGGRLEFQDGRVQHGGYLLGVRNGVDSPWEGAANESQGYHGYLKTAHNLTAVSAACMMVRREVFFSLGGFDAERYPLYFADVDLGLRAVQQGYLNVWTPWARVRHMGGATRLLAEKFQVQERPLLPDYATLRAQWKGALLNDASYHPRMQRMGKAFSVGPGTARFQPPLPGRPLPVILANHVNWQGCGHHRVVQPFKALESNLLAEGGLIHGIPGVMEAAQLQPDVILLELLSGSRFPAIMAQYREVCDAKIVVEYDDYLLNVPLKNGSRKHFPQNMVKNLRKVMESADWIVVSTAPLAEAYSRFHHDIRIAQNRLAEGQWGHLLSERGTGRKVRIGWAGGSSHAGDLEILLPIIKALEGEVEWVFMGMKPRGIQCEFHPGVPFEMYPEKLASLNLDLALVPLEINQFNECKSNLRLLEIGTCGVPIIATNIEPYRCGLPVTLVENRFKDWMAAIRAHLNDMAATRRQGDALREAIHQQWYLRGSGLDDWQQAWLTPQ
ncbi:glycosyltransferase [Pantoea sp. FN0307]|uniref:glycosyltransferase n=1 Tax=Pantoea sp. FN0307 TaxID=3418560 RepID=UPI003CEE1F39